MHKLIRINEKKLRRRYNKRLFIACLPSVSIAVTLLALTVIKPWEETPFYYRFFFMMLNIAAVYAFAACFAGTIIINLVLHGHRRHTYIELFRSHLVVSKAVETRYSSRRLVSYKKLWVLPLTELEDVFCDRNVITVTGKARLISDRADWLDYTCDEHDGLKFDNWWYDENGGSDVTTIEIGDYFLGAGRIADRISFCAERCKLRRERYLEYKEWLLAQAPEKMKPSKRAE